MSPFHESGGSFTVGAGVFLANAAGTAASGIESYLPVFIQSGAMGILAFVLWHVFAKFIPRLMDQIQELQKQFREESAQQRADFRDTLKTDLREILEEVKK